MITYVMRKQDVAKRGWWNYVIAHRLDTVVFVLARITVHVIIRVPVHVRKAGAPMDISVLITHHLHLGHNIMAGRAMPPPVHVQSHHRHVQHIVIPNQTQLFKIHQQKQKVVCPAARDAVHRAAHHAAKHVAHRVRKHAVLHVLMPVT